MRLSSTALLLALLPLAAFAQDQEAPVEFAMPSEEADVAAPAEEAAEPTPQPPQANPTATQSAMPTRDDGRVQSDFTAKLRIMNRKLEKSTDLAIPANQTKRYDTLSITALTCMRDAQGIRDNDMVFLRIEEEGRSLFNGWMSQQFPGVSLLQHPHYSVIVLGCN